MSHRRPCACPHCQCRSHAQEPDHFYNADLKPSARSPTPTLCLVCERAELWGKNAPTYRGCGCTCKCKLEREDGSRLCGDCGEQNRLNPRRHRPHGERRKVRGV
ncbi:hypothetical protein F4781DRAFT_432287 [Annulohypoxylon bovei var. microspora]|nr:hypothetical protein F4781DRAFT_432287 [Annulohypoxylon bovei var. microspora]